jgi:glycosyltransferase involved in cell wall biosynthesis
MNITFPSFVLQGGKSGVARYVINLLSSLQKNCREHCFTVYVPKAERQLLSKQSDSMLIKSCAKITSNPIISILWHNICLPLFGRSNKTDLLHIPSYRRIPYIKKGPMIATVHDLATFRIDDKYDKLRMFYNRKIVPYLINRCDRLITVSEFSKREIIHFTGYDENKIDVIYSGIDHKLFRPICKDAAKERIMLELGLKGQFLCYVSRVEPLAKNHFRLLETFERFKQIHNSPFKLLLVGSDWNGAKEFHKAVENSPVKDDIIFTGFVRDELLPYLYSAAELCIYPSLFEGFGFPVIEALACGAPVICSNTTSLAEISNRRLPNFDPYSVDDMYNCLVDTLLQDNYGQDRRENIKYAQTFNWETASKKVSESYSKCIQSLI